MRRARTTTGTGVICARYMCLRAVAAAGRCPRGICVEKLRTVPAATLQRGAAGVRHRCRRRRRGLRDARPRSETDGGHSAPAPGAARPLGARWAPPAIRGSPDVSLSVGPRDAAGAARARPAGRQRARGVCWRAFRCGMWGCARALTGVVCVAGQKRCTPVLCKSLIDECRRFEHLFYEADLQVFGPAGHDQEDTCGLACCALALLMPRSGKQGEMARKEAKRKCQGPCQWCVVPGKCQGPCGEWCQGPCGNQLFAQPRPCLRPACSPGHQTYAWIAVP